MVLLPPKLPLPQPAVAASPYLKFDAYAAGQRQGVRQEGCPHCDAALWIECVSALPLRGGWAGAGKVKRRARLLPLLASAPTLAMQPSDAAQHTCTMQLLPTPLSPSNTSLQRGGPPPAAACAMPGSGATGRSAGAARRRSLRCEQATRCPVCSASKLTCARAKTRHALALTSRHVAAHCRCVFETV